MFTATGRTVADGFPNNVYPTHYWPVPFCGNPAAALVATVGLNPSSGEFASHRNWGDVEAFQDWKPRLEHYFNQPTPAHEWFGPWRTGLALLDCSYEAGTAAHFDVSYRPTKAVLRNPTTDPSEFRHMVERDVAGLFRLLPLCPKLRGLLVFGPVVRHNGSIESLAGFVRKSAPRHGFSVLPNGGLGVAGMSGAGRSFFLHEVQTAGGRMRTEQGVENLGQQRDSLRQKLALQQSESASPSQ